MPYIPHTDDDVKKMLATIGVKQIDDLFDEIPADLRIKQLNNIPAGLNAWEATRFFQDKAAADQYPLNFIGAGAYEHHIPAAVWDITSRGEFYTAYTPYQAEASQGSLQLIYEYQTMMASLMGMDVSNASLYDGASSLAEAILMATRIQKQHKQPKILVPKTVHPHYGQTIRSIVSMQGIEICELPYDEATGAIQHSELAVFKQQEITAVVIPLPNFFGAIEEFDALTDWAHQHKALVIAVVNPIAVALLKEPGSWGETGADIVCGEGQPLGIPMASGGPYFGFLCCKKDFVRQMPGRIVGRTVDRDGRTGFVLTLQAREQHIRRAKATSNICTNQGLMVTAATIYMSLLGEAGLRQIALAAHANTELLFKQLCTIPGIKPVFNNLYFHEIIVQLPANAQQILDTLAKLGIEAGFNLSNDYPELKNCILICATETKTKSDIEYFVQKMSEVITNQKSITPSKAVIS